MVTWHEAKHLRCEEFEGVPVARLPIAPLANELETFGRRLATGLAWLATRRRWAFATSMRDVRGMITCAGPVAKYIGGRFDLVEACDWGATAAVFASPKMRGLRVATLHASIYSHKVRYAPLLDFHPLDVAIAERCERVGLQRAQVVAYPSQEVLDDAEAAGMLNPAVRRVSAPNCVDVGYVRSLSQSAAARGQSSSEVRVLFAGRVDALKGAMVLDHVIGDLRSGDDATSWRFTIAGEAAAPAECAQLATGTEAGVRVDFVNQLEIRDVYRLLGDQDILILPSHTENCPMIVLEAMAARLPVISTSVGAVPSMLAGGSAGILCSKANPSEFVRALRHLSTGSNRADLARRAYAHVRASYDAPASCSAWLDQVQGSARGT